MKTPLLCAITLAFLPFTLGCQSSGQQQADNTGTQMDELRTNVESSKTSVRASAASLASVVEKAEVDPKPAYAQFEKDSAAVESKVKATEASFQAVADNSKVYFANWQAQAAAMQDPDLKKAADEQRAKLVKYIEDLRQKMDALRGETTPFVATLKDMQTYLHNDLTPSGIKSVSSKSKQVGKSANSICEKYDDVMESLDKAAPAFKTAKPPPPPAK